jgi:hypothetical protein
VCFLDLSFAVLTCLSCVSSPHFFMQSTTLSKNGVTNCTILYSPSYHIPHLASPHLASPHLISPPLTLPHLTLSHLPSPHLTSPHLPLPPLTSPCLALPHLPLSPLTTSHFTSPCLACSDIPSSNNRHQCCQYEPMGARPHHKESQLADRE